MQNFTAVYIPNKDNTGFTAFVGEYPGVIAEAKTKDEAREILADSLRLVLDYKRKQSMERFSNAQIETLAIA